MSIEKLLIFRVGHLGDTVVALPALWAVRRHLPNTRISLLTNIDRRNPEYISPTDVLPPNGLIDDFIAYPTNAGVFGSVKARLELAARLRRERFDAALYLMPRVRSRKQVDRDRSFFRIAGINDVKGIDFLYGNRLEYPVPFPTPAVERESDFLLRMVSEMGFRAGAAESELRLSKDEIATGEKWLESSISSDITRKNFIAVAVGGKWQFKCWNEDNYLKVVSRLIEETNCYPILFGSAGDREMSSRLLDAWDVGANACGHLSVRESAAVLGKCKLYLGNDTGTMHLAAAMGVPCVALFSTMDFVGRWSPMGDDHRVFRSNSKCDGCIDTDFNRPHTCMDAIEVDDVLTASLEILNR